MIHTIVVEVPDYVDSGDTELRLRAAIERVFWSRPHPRRPGLRINIPAEVVEYHHRKMTTTGGE